ncbi:MAG: hypothetical protein KJ879_03195, partial [Nanoarchaeota archaeon]|nr:hypothetical protein [Nanoarchaeota archaeon]
MNKEKSYLVVAVLVALAVIALYYWGGSPTGFAIFSEASDLNSGTFSDTLYNGTAILLNGSSGLLTGNYTSPVFGNGSSVVWNNISWQGGVPTDSTLLFKVTDCSSSNCSDAAFADATSLNNLVSLTGLNEPYFQYITLFSIKKLDVDSASLTSAVVGYTLLD